VPGLPSVAQEGVKGYSFELWWGMLAPPKTPAAIVAAINAEVNRLTASEELREAFAREGAEPSALTPAQFAATIRDEIAGWKKVAREAGIRPE
jgi:tripartite-type tricarboxylate transporter receptor subunit TctC